MREKDGRVRPVFLDKNRHICYALNCGLKEAKGRFIARIDCGDQFYPDKLALQMEYLLQHPECGACFTLVDLIDGKGTVINEKEKLSISGISSLIELKLSGSIILFIEAIA